MSLILQNAIVVDLSHWQPPSAIDWRKAKDSGVVGAIVKLIQGGSLDPAAVYHLYNAYQAGIPLLGMYDFGTGNPDHVAFLNAALTEFNNNVDRVLIALDAEKNPSSQMAVQDAEVWARGVHDKLGRWAVTYMGRDGPDGTGRGLPSAVLSESDLWLPKYGPEPDASKLPPGFRLPQNDTERGGVVRLWQFTGDGINAPENWPDGIPEKCDLSYALFETMDGLTAWWGT